MRVSSRRAAVCDWNPQPPVDAGAKYPCTSTIFCAVALDHVQICDPPDADDDGTTARLATVAPAVSWCSTGSAGPG
ncbi:MAG: hypothetical protein R2713_14505 [Ilumatobacteraceae bacterium]